MQIIHVEGYLDVHGFEEICHNHGLDPANVVFLFPGNVSHHGEETNLFSVKAGGGLAMLAKQNGLKGYPVLSLPTTSMEDWSSDIEQQTIVQGAIADLYRALGAGYNFMLPVREHNTRDYFTNGLQYSAGKKEPSFWGGIQQASNRLLADYYNNELNYFQDFIALSDEEQQALAKSDEANPFCAAYLNGKNMQPDDPWLQSSVSNVLDQPRRPGKS